MRRQHMLLPISCLFRISISQRKEKKKNEFEDSLLVLEYECEASMRAISSIRYVDRLAKAAKSHNCECGTSDKERARMRTRSIALKMVVSASDYHYYYYYYWDITYYCRPGRSPIQIT